MLCSRDKPDDEVKAMQNQQTSLIQWAVLAVTIFAAWKIWRSAKQVFWTGMGITWVSYWTGFNPLHWFF
jgi:hypothetical protein